MQSSQRDHQINPEDPRPRWSAHLWLQAAIGHVLPTGQHVAVHPCSAHCCVTHHNGEYHLFLFQQYYFQVIFLTNQSVFHHKTTTRGSPQVAPFELLASLSRLSAEDLRERTSAVASAVEAVAGAAAAAGGGGPGEGLGDAAAPPHAETQAQRIIASAQRR